MEALDGPKTIRQLMQPQRPPRQHGEPPPTEQVPLRPTVVITADLHVAKPEGHIHLPTHPLKWST